MRATGIRVIGNVQAKNARLVVLRGGSRVGGSVQIVQGGGARVVASNVTGDIGEATRTRVEDRWERMSGGAVHCPFEAACE